MRSTIAAPPDEERRESPPESDVGEALLVWNARVASIRARAWGRMRRTRSARDVDRGDRDVAAGVRCVDARATSTPSQAEAAEPLRARAP